MMTIHSKDDGFVEDDGFLEGYTSNMIIQGGPCDPPKGSSYPRLDGVCHVSGLFHFSQII